MTALRKVVASVALAAAAASCGGSRGAGGAAEPESAPPPPNLLGARVMLIPAQAGEPESLDSELTFWLTDRAPETHWVLPADVEAAVRRAPGSGMNLDAARRVVDIGGGDRRVADPLYGDLRRLGAITNTTLAVVPLASRETADSTGLTVELAAAVVAVRAGRVIWMHTVAGDPSESRSTAIASAAARLARTLIPWDG